MNLSTSYEAHINGNHAIEIKEGEVNEILHALTVDLLTDFSYKLFNLNTYHSILSGNTNQYTIIAIMLDNVV